MTLPTDPNVLAFLAAQNTLRDGQELAQLMHVVDSFGRPGSLTVGGQRFALLGTVADLLNVTGIVYAAQHGWVDVNDVTLADDPFKIDLPMQWHVDERTETVNV